MTIASCGSFPRVAVALEGRRDIPRSDPGRCGMVRSEDERSAEIRVFLVMVNNGICIWDYTGLYGIIWDLMVNNGFFMV